MKVKYERIEKGWYDAAININGKRLGLNIFCCCCENGENPNCPFVLHKDEVKCPYKSPKTCEWHENHLGKELEGSIEELILIISFIKQSSRISSFVCDSLLDALNSGRVPDEDDIRAALVYESMVR